MSRVDVGGGRASLFRTEGNFRQFLFLFHLNLLQLHIFIPLNSYAGVDLRSLPRLGQETALIAFEIDSRARSSSAEHTLSWMQSAAFYDNMGAICNWPWLSQRCPCRGKYREGKNCGDWEWELG